MASSAMEEEIEISHELLPCYICGRTFLPCPLKKHIKVCERNATRKRKIFDSLKQRVEGTDLAPFHQPTFLKKTTDNQPQLTTPVSAPEIGSNTQRSQSKWKEKHEEFVQTIRAAKGEKVMGPRRSISAVGTMGTTERCPYCERQFGPKSYDRHVDWCKEHKNRVTKSPANVIQAKERLEARTKYRVPPLNKSKRSITREKYSTSLSRTESVVSVRSAGSVERVGPERIVVLERSPSVRRSKAMVATHHHHSAPEPIIKSKATVEKTKSTSIPEEYNPFVVAEKQLMELLQCDDFKPYNTSTPPKNQSSKCAPPKSNTTSQNKNSKTNSNSKTPSAKRSSIIDPPDNFQDKMLLLQDNFELIENFINDNYVSNDTIISQKISTKSKVNNHSDSNRNKTTDGLSLNCILSGRKYSDDMNSIDPSLINETDNLSIPDKLPLDNYCSPTSSTHELDHYSVQYDKKISVFEPAKNDKIKRSLSSQDEQTLDDIDFDEFISSFDDDESFPTLKSFLQSTKSDKSEKKIVQKSTLSLNSSFGKNIPAKGPEIKKPITPLKRSVSLSNPVVKARSMKNKQDIQEYLHAKDTKPAKKVSPKLNEDLFPPDHEMYEEYKKYKDLYKQEKNEFIAEEKKATMGEGDYDEISSNEDAHMARKLHAVKVSGDSAYGSLNRKSPKIQPKASSNRHGQMPLRSSVERSPSSSGSETSVTVPAAKTKSRIPKFCHECGTKYPVDVAKFCVECGVKRLVL